MCPPRASTGISATSRPYACDEPADAGRHEQYEKRGGGGLRDGGHDADADADTYYVLDKDRTQAGGYLGEGISGPDESDEFEPARSPCRVFRS